MKKTLAILLAMALLCMMAVGTTLTYFTDEDGDVNTMTVGTVYIRQHETDRAGNSINKDALALYPVTTTPDSDGLIPVANNGVDKVVTVENIGTGAAYIRTIFAFELKQDGTSPIGTEVILVQNGIQMTNVEIEKNGVKYILGVCTYADPLGSTSVSAPSLKQVYLHSSVGNEFSTAIGGQYDIMVLSQAVQTQGFDGADAALNTAFGAVDAANATEWFANLPTT